jgi:ATP phosphoribosyltransferase regulatory subunit HisZ
MLDKAFLSEILILKAIEIGRDEYYAYNRSISTPISQEGAVQLGLCRSHNRILADLKDKLGMSEPETMPLRDALKKAAIQTLHTQLSQLTHNKLRDETRAEVDANRQQEELDELIYLDGLGELEQGGFA